MFISFSFSCNAQNLSKRNKQIRAIADTINKYYIFEEVANQLSEKLKSEIELKTFDTFSDKEFAKLLSSYLTKNGNKLYFNMLYKPELIEKKT